MPIVIAPPADRWSFGGLNLQADTLRIRAIQGYGAVPAVVGGGIKLISTHGERFFKRLHGARKMSFTIDLFSASADLLPIHQALDALATVFGTTHRELPLIHHHPDGIDRVGYGICVAWNPGDISEVGELYVGTADIMLSDPYFYRPDIDTGVLAISSSADYLWNFHHPGTVRGSHMKFYIVGPGSTEITIFNNSVTSVPYFRITLPIPLAAGEIIIVDTKAFTVIQNGVNVPGRLTHGAWPPGSIPTFYEFMLLDPGDNFMGIRGMYAGSSVQQIFSPPFL